MTSREFNQHTGRAKAAAAHGPVIITDRGEPAYVLMSYQQYERFTPKSGSISLLSLADPNGSDDFDLMDYIPERRVEPQRSTFDDED